MHTIFVLNMTYRFALIRLLHNADQVGVMIFLIIIPTLASQKSRIFLLNFPHSLDTYANDSDYILV